MFKLQIITYWLRILFRGNFSSREKLKKFQKRQLNRFAKTILVKAPFYKNYFLLNREFDASVIPVVNKAFFMEHFDEMNTVGVKSADAMRVALESETSRNFSPEINGITVGLSTGTSGKRGLFLVAPEERAHWAGMVMNRVIKPKLFRKTKVAFFLRANNNLYSSVQSSLFEFKYFDIFLPMEQLVKELEEFSPHVIAAQPSVHLSILSHMKTKLRPELIISFAEVLEKDVKKVLMENYACTLREVYQCTEGFLGVSCEHGTLHLNEDVVYVEKEMIDETHFIPIITDFTRSTQTIVRYRLDDILELKKTKCSCGSSFLAIESISGREGDVFIFNDNRVKIFSDLFARRIAVEVNGYHHYQLIQYGQGKIEIRLEAPDADQFILVATAMENTIRKLLNEFNVSDVTINSVQGYLHQPGQKFRRFSRII